MNLLSLSALVHDKEASVWFLQNRGILHTSRKCKNGHSMNLVLSEMRDRWRCSKRECRYEIGLRNGTWLDGSHISYRDLIIFIYCWSQELTSIRFCKIELLLSEKTIVDYNNYLREVCAAYLLRNPKQIGGLNKTVEIDESLFSRRKNNMGRILPQKWVFGGICRESGKCFLFAVTDKTSLTLLPIISKCILPGSTIISDKWGAYNDIAKLPNNYRHLIVNHSEHFVDPISGAHTQTIESNWRIAKSRNKRQNGTSREMLDSYLCEYMWRKELGGIDAFDKILRDIVDYWPPETDSI
jgi:transposase-like protein